LGRESEQQKVLTDKKKHERKKTPKYETSANGEDTALPTQRTTGNHGETGEKLRRHGCWCNWGSLFTIICENGEGRWGRKTIWNGFGARECEVGNQWWGEGQPEGKKKMKEATGTD